ncbi:hypothetical protein L1987_86074 [Smallanthus sonchifolius]|uniref:Uncharacterized protein n=1 Tax=Smallanthus sonchifolius TaxID=185202 RepID=A0ACB8XZI9_9ASTR|nr:hypothetical protein L1987_86074 [Smallanthus sonchifolius]
MLAWFISLYEIIQYGNMQLSVIFGRLRTDELYYSIGSETLRFGPKEFCLMTGFRFADWSEPISTLNVKFKDRVLGGARLNCKEVVKFYVGDLSGVEDDDVVRLSLLLVEYDFKET